MLIIEANYAKKVGLPSYSSHQFAVTLRTELTDLSQLEKTCADLSQRLQAAVDTQSVNPGLVPIANGGLSAAAPRTTSPAQPRDKDQRRRQPCPGRGGRTVDHGLTPDTPGSTRGIGELERTTPLSRTVRFFTFRPRPYPLNSASSQTS